MAWNDDRHGVSVQGPTDCPRGPRTANLCGERPVRRRLCVRNTPELFEDLPLKRGNAGEVDVELERLPPPREVFVELATHRIDGARNAQDPHSGPLSQPSELGLWVGIEGNAADAAGADSDEQGPE